MLAPRPCRRALAAAALLLVTAPGAAHAQFGKLIKRAASAATEAAAGAAGKKAAAAAGVAGADAAPDGASGAASQLEITAERLDAFVVAMRGPVEAARQRAAYAARVAAFETSMAEYAKRKPAYDQCRADYVGRTRPDGSAAAQARHARLSDEMGALSDRASRASEAGNRALTTQLGDSVQRLLAAVEAVNYPGLARACPAPGPAPERPADTAPGPNSPAFRPAMPAGMTPVQFGLLRERVAAWLLATDRRYTYADAERQALESRRAALAPMTELFRGRHLAWGEMLHGLRDGE